MKTRCIQWYSLAALVVVLAQSAAAASLDTTEEYLGVQRAFLQEDFQTVTSLARVFVLRHPDAPETPRVWIWLALSLERLQQSTEALDALDTLENRLEPNDPLWPEALFWEADMSRRSLQMARAKSAFQQLAQRYPHSTWAPRAQLGLGLSYLHQQAFELAIGYFHDVADHAAETPMGLDARMFEGLCALRLQRFSDAVAVLRPLLDQLRDPGAIAQAAFYLGESLSGLGAFDEAITAYQRAVNTKEASQWTRYALFGQGWANFRAKRCEESIKVFDRYLAQTVLDHRTEALFAQGSCLMQLGKEPDALKAFQQILARDLDNPLALESGLVIVDAYRRQEQYPLAKSLIHTLLRRRIDERGRAQLQLRLGAIALDQGNTAQAQTVYRLAADHEDPSIRQAALNGLGDIQVYVGNLPQAQQYYEQAIRTLDASSAASYARYQVGRISLQLGDAATAVRMFQQLLEQADPALADDVRLALALTYVNQGNDEQARAALETIQRDRSGTPMAARTAYYLALLALGKEDEAGVERLCREAIAGAPKTDEAVDAQLLLVDLAARRTSAHDAMRMLAASYRSSGLPARQRAKLAKRLGDFAQEEGSLAQAIWWYDEALDLLPSLRDEVLYRTASCYETGGDEELAMQWYRAIEQPPWRVRGQLAAAKLLERQDRINDAEAIYEALAREPIPEAKMVRERLAVLRGDIRKNEE